MKQALSILALFAFLTACTTPQRTAYISLSAIGQAVDSAMSAAADATVAGQVSAADWQRIATVHAQFRAAYRTACELAAFDYTKAAAPELLRLEKMVLDTIAAILAKPKPAPSFNGDIIYSNPIWTPPTIVITNAVVPL